MIEPFGSHSPRIHSSYLDQGSVEDPLTIKKDHIGQADHMRSSNKARSRNKGSHNRNRGGSVGNIVNRVFDSSGPEGKVRGTPQQIIDKYQMLSRDAQLAGDRVAAENFLQHSEHYSRMLVEANREMNERREAQEAQRLSQQAQQAQQQPERKPNPQPVIEVSDDQPSVPDADAGDLFPGREDTSNLVQTPESLPKKPRQIRPRKKPARNPAVENEPETVAENAAAGPAGQIPDSAAE